MLCATHLKMVLADRDSIHSIFEVLSLGLGKVPPNVGVFIEIGMIHLPVSDVYHYEIDFVNKIKEMWAWNTSSMVKST